MRPAHCSNFYSGYDGKSWHTGSRLRRTAFPGRRKGKVFSPDSATWEGGYIAANGSSLSQPAGILHWYQGARVPRIGSRGWFEKTRTTRTGSRAAG